VDDDRRHVGMRPGQEDKMRYIIIAATLVAVSGGSSAFAQTAGTMPGASTTPGIMATTPLGMAPGSSVRPAGIPLGSTELASPGLSPLPLGSPIGGLALCSIAPGATSGMAGAGSSMGMYDGGGTAAVGNSTSPCGGNAGASAGNMLSSTPSPGGATRPGIPLGSYEMGNAGVSAVPAVPTPSPTISNILPGNSTCNGMGSTGGHSGIC
jgi:hypothetical protein